MELHLTERSKRKGKKSDKVSQRICRVLLVDLANFVNLGNLWRLTQPNHLQPNKQLEILLLAHHKHSMPVVVAPMQENS